MQGKSLILCDELLEFVDEATSKSVRPFVVMNATAHPEAPEDIDEKDVSTSTLPEKREYANLFDPLIVRRNNAIQAIYQFVFQPLGILLICIYSALFLVE